jgi:hypothetical protein
MAMPISFLTALYAYIIGTVGIVVNGLCERPHLAGSESPVELLFQDPSEDENLPLSCPHHYKAVILRENYFSI